MGGAVYFAFIPAGEIIIRRVFSTGNNAALNCYSRGGVLSMVSVTAEVVIEDWESSGDLLPSSYWEVGTPQNVLDFIGGIAYFQDMGNVTLSRCTWKDMNIYCVHEPRFLKGGLLAAYDVENIRVMDSLFESALLSYSTYSTTRHYGGILYFTGTSSSVLLSNVTISAIRSLNRDSLFEGVAVYGGHLKRVDIANCTFDNIGVSSSSGSITGAGLFFVDLELMIENSLFESITGGSGSFSSGALGLSQSKVSLSRSIFRKNTASIDATGYGGAVVLFSGELDIFDCVFEGNNGNRAQSSDTKLTTGRGGAIYLDNPTLVRINSCNFTENVANNGVGSGFGGVIYLKMAGIVEVTNSLFSGNGAAFGAQASGYGGVFHAIGPHQQNVSFENCKFTNNYASKSGIGFGGVMSIDRGELYHDCPAMDFVVTNCTASGNYAQIHGPLGGQGGVFFVGCTQSGSRFRFRNSHFMDNSAAYEGKGSGGVFADASPNRFSDTNQEVRVDVTHCTFTKNFGSKGVFPSGGGVYATIVNGSIGFDSCEFLRNYGGNGVGYGGVGFIDGGFSRIRNSELVDNVGSLTSLGFGGVIGHDVGDFVAEDCTFRDNAASVYVFGQGGVLYATESGNIEFLRCDFSSNVGSGMGRGNGGVVGTGSGRVHISISHGMFDTNLGSGYGSGLGGVFMSHGAIISVDHSNFTSNGASWFADGYGGIAAMHGSARIDMHVCTFWDSFGSFTSNGVGGCMYLAEAAQGTFIDCEFHRSRASVSDSSSVMGLGGVIMSAYETYVVIERCLFKDSASLSPYDDMKLTEPGGTIYFASEKSITIRNSQFVHGSSLKGSALYLDTEFSSLQRGIAVIDGCLFEKNVAQSGGAAIYASNFNLEITSSTFLNQKCYCKENAECNGCTFFVRDSSVKMHDVQVRESELLFQNGKELVISGNGGVIYAINSDVNFNGRAQISRAGMGGFGFFQSSSVVINGSTVESATALVSGGAFQLGSGSSVKVTASTFRDNSAFQSSMDSSYAGVVYMESGTTLTTDSQCIFSRNNGTYGGVFAVESETSFSLDGSFEENRASISGGVIYSTDHRTCPTLSSNAHVRGNSAGEYGAVIASSPSGGVGSTLKRVFPGKVFDFDMSVIDACLQTVSLGHSKPYELTLKTWNQQLPTGNLVASPLSGVAHFTFSMASAPHSGKLVDVPVSVTSVDNPNSPVSVKLGIPLVDCMFGFYTFTYPDDTYTCIACGKDAYTLIDGAPTCFDCFSLTGATCFYPESSTDVSEVGVYARPDHWVMGDSDGQAHTFLCPRHFCRGYKTTSSRDTCVGACNRCSSGHETRSFVCGECEDGYSLWGSSCRRCEGTNVWLLIMWIAISFAFICVHQFLSQFASPAIRSLMTFLQLSIYVGGREYETEIFSFEIGYPGRDSCIFPRSLMGGLFMNMLAPFILCVELLFLFLVTRIGVLKRRLGRYGTGESFVRSFLLLMLFGYNILVGTSIVGISCTDRGQGFNVLLTYPGISCDAQTYKSVEWVFWLCAVIFVVIVPVGLLVSLLRLRRHVGKIQIQRKYGSLFETNKPNMFWYEFVVLFRRTAFALSSILMSRYEDEYSGMAGLVVMIVAFSFAILHIFVSPSVDPVSNNVEILALLALSAMACCQSNGDAMRQQNLDESVNRVVHGAVLFLTLAAIILVAIIQWIREKRKPFSRSIRRDPEFVKRLTATRRLKELKKTLSEPLLEDQE
eukprot:TRINITY_DN511_c0_g12_i1.p1 TRINITY_DN511_c0_g12~~TRINITY_DN511_c0_g12_i1.p1  ORF type:complete len:1919 (-),score=356.09 TRINITY_DN511_c0_g12_i1:170-5332(-)